MYYKMYFNNIYIYIIYIYIINSSPQNKIEHVCMGNSAKNITYSILETLSFSGLLNTGMATTHLWAIGPGGRECIMFIHTYYQYIGVGLLCPIKQELMFFCFPLPSLIYQKLRWFVFASGLPAEWRRQFRRSHFAIGPAEIKPGAISSPCKPWMDVLL